MKIFVVIVTYNGAPWIRTALDSLRLSDVACTVIVIDNASTDNTVAIVKERYPEVLLRALGENVGFGRGNNVGIAMALRSDADFVFLLNQDAYVTPTAIGMLGAFLDQHPQYAIASPLHCGPDLRALDPYTRVAYLQRYAAEYLSDACLGQTKSFYDLRGINAAAWMVKAGAFRRVGGFDPLFFMYGEDDDLIARFEYFGERFALLPASRIVHLRGKSPAPLGGPPRQIWSLSERARSELLIDVKRPTGSFPGRVLRLFANGLVHPLGCFVVSHDLKQFLGYVLATLRVLIAYRRTRQSSKVCATPGAHFLDLKT